jgi:hypothetical protein
MTMLGKRPNLHSCSLSAHFPLQFHRTHPRSSRILNATKTKPTATLTLYLIEDPIYGFFPPLIAKNLEIRLQAPKPPGF